MPLLLEFIYSEKATKFCEIFPLLLSYGVPVKSKGKISQNFVAFSEYMNFKDAPADQALCLCEIAQCDSSSTIFRFCWFHDIIFIVRSSLKYVDFLLSVEAIDNF